MGRGRKRTLINAREFQAELDKLEAAQTFASRTELWAAFELTAWAKSQTPRPLTAQMAYIKSKELDISIKTPVGRRGAVKGCKPVNPGGRRKRKMDDEAVNAMANGIPKEEREKLEKSIDKAGNGSLKAAVKLMCLDCTNWSPVDVRECQIKKCPLWNYRPYKQRETLKELPVVE